MCTAASFIAAQDRKQARCPSTGAWLNYSMYLCTHHEGSVHKEKPTNDTCNSDLSPRNYGDFKSPLQKVINSVCVIYIYFSTHIYKLYNFYIYKLYNFYIYKLYIF